MSLKNIPKEELELLSYTDLAYTIIKDNQKPMNTPSIFKIICDLLEYSNEEYSNKIGDFYTSLTTDKKPLIIARVIGLVGLSTKSPLYIISIFCTRSCSAW